jgi:hypothetical protein
MNKWLALIFISLTLTFKVSGQNTLFHTSFEVDASSQCRFASNYYSYGFDSTVFENFYQEIFTSLNSLDIYCNCDSIELNGDMADALFSIPNNRLGHQYPYTGQNYMGLVTFTKSSANTQYREWLGISLPVKLVANNYYKIEYYTSLADTSKLITAPPQIYFSNDSINLGLTGNINDFTLNFYIDENYLALPNPELFTDSINWLKETILYLAHGGEEYLYLGNFKNNANTPYDTTIHYDIQQSNYAYFYIDDLTVYELDSTVSTGENIIDKIKIYPNPAQDYLVVDGGELTAVQVELFDISGRKLLQQKVSTNQEQVDVSGLANGVYIAVVRSGRQVVKREKVVVSR